MEKTFLLSVLLFDEGGREPYSMWQLWVPENDFNYEVFVSKFQYDVDLAKEACSSIEDWNTDDLLAELSKKGYDIDGSCAYCNIFA